MRQSRRLQHAIERTEPDLVHAMRIPYEGMAAARAVPPQIPFLLSIWGNDLTLHAPANRLMRNATRHALERADALQCDCGRDVRLAEAWGWVPTRPSIVVPGIGGVDVNVFHPGKSTLREQLGLDPGVPIVLNPRGLREYVCWDSYLEAIPVIAARRPDVHFVCTGMSESAAVKRRVADLGITTRLTLLPPLGHAAMADVFRAADVSVSPSVHDGTPNTLLEAMASGALPVVGRLDSVLEWIEDGQNGLVCDPTDPDSVATAVIEALENARLRARATTINGSLIEERADFGRSMDAVDAFYRTVIQAGTSVVSDKAS
jgi:glycosyltransferase involved in cell wall biosynthesis